MAENNLDKTYELILKRRQKAVDRNLAEGRTAQMHGTPFNDSSIKTAGPGTPSLTGRLPNVDILDDLPDAPKVPKTTSLQRINSPSKFGKTLKALGILGPGLAALGIGEKAMAGEFGSAGLDAADIGTDYVPVVGQVKSALRPTELGNAELPDEMMKERELYNAARRAKSGEVINNPSLEQPLLEPEDRVKKEQLDALFKNTMGRIK